MYLHEDVALWIAWVDTLYKVSTFCTPVGKVTNPIFAFGIELDMPW